MNFVGYVLGTLALLALCAFFFFLLVFAYISWRDDREARRKSDEYAETERERGRRKAAGEWVNDEVMAANNEECKVSSDPITLSPLAAAVLRLLREGIPAVFPCLYRRMVFDQAFTVGPLLVSERGGKGKVYHRIGGDVFDLKELLQPAEWNQVINVAAEAMKRYKVRETELAKRRILDAASTVAMSPELVASHFWQPVGAGVPDSAALRLSDGDDGCSSCGFDDCSGGDSDGADGDGGDSGGDGGGGGD